jgi:hypothetical protein
LQDKDTQPRIGRRDSETSRLRFVRIKKGEEGWAHMAHTCNPSYSGSSDQENWGSNPALANSSCDPVLKITNT